MIVILIMFCQQVAVMDRDGPTDDPAHVPLRFIGDETLRKEFRLRVVDPPQSESFQVSLPVNTGRLVASTTPDVKVTRQGDIRNVSIDFSSDGLPSGQYEGTFRVLKPDGVVLNSIPITVSVKDGPIRPWLTALFGVSVGIALSYYKREGQQVDEMTVGEAELRARLLADDALRSDPVAAPFREKINSELVVYGSEFGSGNWQPAHDHLAEATRCFKLWALERDRWMAALGDFAAQANNLQFQGPLRDAAASFLQSVADEVTAFSNARDFVRRADSVRACLVIGERVATRLQDLKEATQQLKDPGGPQDRISFLEDKLRTMTGDQFAVPANLNKLVDEVLEEHGKVAAQLRDERAIGADAHMIAPMSSTAPSLLSLPDLDIEKPGARMQRIWVARARRSLHAWGVTALAVTALTSMGILQLYYKDIDFGTGWDYASLFVWGLGAESSSVSAKEWLSTASGKDKTAVGQS